MSKIAFLGLGHMGTPLATRLLGAGHDVTVWNREPEATAPLRDAGARVAESPADAGAGVDFAITMVTNPEAVDNVLFGDNGLASALSPGQTWVDMSTIGPDAFRSAAARLPKGVAGIDAPVRGSVPEATDGKLLIFVGAENADFERVRPILSVLGEVHHVGVPGTGAAMKLVVNITLTASIVALGEALALGNTFGLEQASMLDILAESPIGSTVKAKRTNVETGHFPANFKLSLADKDTRLALEAAQRSGIALPTTASIHEWLDKTAENGAADLDFSTVVATITGEPANA